jgi:hypothetical protein
MKEGKTSKIENERPIGGSGRQSDLVENNEKVDVKALKAYFLAKTSGNNSPLPSLHGEMDLFLSGTDKEAAKPKKKFKSTIPLDARRAKTQLAKNLVENIKKVDVKALKAYFLAKTSGIS